MAAIVTEEVLDKMSLYQRQLQVVVSADTKEYTELHLAVMKRRYRKIEYLLKNDADIEAHNSYGLTPLHLAASLRDIQSAELLLNRGAQPKPECCAKFPPLMFAVAAKCRPLVQLFIKHGCNIDELVDQSFGYLHYWVRHNDKEMVNFLLECGADINNLDSDNSTPLCIAVRYKCVSIINFLLEKGACVNDNFKVGHSALLEALYTNDEQIFKLLIPYAENCSDENRDGDNILLVATKHSQYEIMRLLLEMGAEPDVTCDLFMTPLHHAVRKDDHRAILLLCEYQANACGPRTPSYLAPKIHDILAKDGVLRNTRKLDSDYDSFTAFDFAIIYKRDCIDTMLCSMRDWDYHIEEKFCKHFYADNMRYLQFFVKNKVAGLSAYNRFYSPEARAQTRSVMMTMYENVCITELGKMKSHNILANVSFHEFMTSPKSKLVVHTKHQDVIDYFNGDRYKNEFPVYKDVLMWTFVTGRRYVRSWQRSIATLNKLFQFRLPDVVSENILNHLSNGDVRMVDRALKILDQ